MSLRYCFEKAYIKKTLDKCKRNDLAVIDTSGCEPLVKDAVKRGVLVYGYLNIGALEDGRSYYQKFKNLRLAYYDGWDGEYWIDVTDKGWQEHILDLAKKIKACGAIGNTTVKSGNITVKNTTVVSWLQYLNPCPRINLLMVSRLKFRCTWISVKK